MTRKPVVVIVDSGLRGPGGHNLSYTSAVARALAERGAAVEVLVNRGCPAELAARGGYHPAFTSGAYDHPLGRGRWRDLAYLYAQSEVFAQELEHAFARVLRRPADLVFSHTVADFELVGWRRFVRRSRFGGHLAVLLRNTPRYSTINPVRRRVNPYLRLRPACLSALARRLGDRFRLCTDSELLTRDYARVYSGPIVTLPIPLTPEVRERTGGSRRASTVPVVGFLGDARTPKGFHLLPLAVDGVRAAGLEARFVVQCNLPLGGSEPAIDAALQRLRSDSQVELVSTPLDDAAYASLLGQLDVVLLPYVHPTYQEATSGVFTEAVAQGTPVVVPTGGWMQHELGDSGAGVTFDREHPEEMPGALVRLLRSLEIHRAAAQRRAETWRSIHNPEALVEKLFDATMGPEPNRRLV